MSITKKNKIKKNELKTDSVISDTIHFGIELELFGEGSTEHDDDACSESGEENRRNDLECQSVTDLLENELGLNRDDARRLRSYVDTSEIISDLMSNYSHECQGDCSFESTGVDRRELSRDLIRLTGNTSIKVVEDGSVLDNDENRGASAEVCWNYFVSKDTIKDNKKILDYLRDDADLNFNKTCGLHINLNNYLKLDCQKRIDTSRLSFLFNYVAKSRRLNSYCNKNAISNYNDGIDKYSMINNQGDRLEFRFFSPTLDAKKLHHYTILAHHVYKRLCGKDSKLPKRTENYLREKMKTVNGLDQYSIDSTIFATNALVSYDVLARESLGISEDCKESEAEYV